MNRTNDPALCSWVPVATDSHFPIQNLPFGVFRSKGGTHVGVAIGDMVLDLTVIAERGLLDGASGDARTYFVDGLEQFLAAGPATWREVRATISRLLSADEAVLRDDRELRKQAMTPRSEVEMLLPVQVGDYTDFYSSREHASNVGSMFRGADNALTPNWLHMPIAYHGRASSVIVSGRDVRRPLGQMTPEGVSVPIFGPTRALDFELELGIIIGVGNRLGEPIPVDRASEHVFGMVLVNDWSARDIQRWEYQPLGPFLGKNFATSMSPWIVPLEALEPYRVAGPVQTPAPLPYLRSTGDWGFDIRLEVDLQSEKIDRPQRICSSNARHLYWNICQQMAHHTVNGCNLRPGDLLASGTISGPTPDSYGSMLELAWKGTKPIALPSGETRAFLQDGDRVTMTGWCQGNGYRIGFGTLTGAILPSHQLDCPD